MCSLKLRAILILSGWMLLSSCQVVKRSADPAATSPVQQISTATVAAVTMVPTATATLQPAPQLTTVPTSAPTILPTPTSAPALVIAVPPAWFEPAQLAAGHLSQPAGGERWQVISAEDPGQLLAQDGAEAALVQGDNGVIVSEETLVLAVPFTTAWENVTELEAQEIVSEGHALAITMRWRDMPRDYKALRIDNRRPTDHGYPLKESWSLVAAPGYEIELNELANAWRRALPGDPIVQLAVVGDLMLDRSLGNAIQKGDLAYPFVQVVEQLATADITVGNMESALGDSGEPAEKHYTFRAPPQAAAAYAAAGFDILSLANNHALDFGPETLLQGISLLEAEGIATVGAGANSREAHQPKFQIVNGLKLAFLSYVNVPVEVGGFDTASWTATPGKPGLAWGNVEEIRADVAAAVPQADLTIVLMHSGLEYVVAPSEIQVAASRAAIEAGAQLVVGHHSHILQGIEYYREGVILYGIGNFAFQIEGDPQTAIFNIWLDSNGVRQIEVMPAIIQFGGQPRMASPDEAQAIRQQVYQLTRLLNPH